MLLDLSEDLVDLGLSLTPWQDAMGVLANLGDRLGQPVVIEGICASSAYSIHGSSLVLFRAPNEDGGHRDHGNAQTPRHILLLRPVAGKAGAVGPKHLFAGPSISGTIPSR